MKLFEFGQYWDLFTFFFFMITGFTISFLAYHGRKRDVKRKSEQKFNLWYFLIFLIIVCMYTFKSIDYGADTSRYIEGFKQQITPFTAYNASWEPFFQVYTYLVRHFSDNYRLFFFFSGIIMSYSYVVFIRKFWKDETEYLFLSLIALQIGYDMNILRSGLGCAFLYASFCALRDNKKKMAVIYTTIGTLFHFTLIVNYIFIAFYCILTSKNKISKTKTICYTISLFVGAFIAVFIVKNLLLRTRYAYYFTTTTMTPTIAGNWNIILTAGLAFLLIKSNVRNERLYIVELAALFNFVLIVPVIILGAYRVTQYYFLPGLLIWGTSLNRLKGSWGALWLGRKIVVFMMVIFYFLFVLSRRSGIPGYVLSFGV